jgi:ATP-dependent exoDNAse (exonuclease V) beta subunit
LLLRWLDKLCLRRAGADCALDRFVRRILGQYAHSVPSRRLLTRVADAADEAELDDIYETERRLLYVACTRAREHLLLAGVKPTSEYLSDFTA